MTKPTKKLVCFDLDGTITDRDLSNVLIKRNSPRGIEALNPANATREAIETRLRLISASTFESKGFIRNKNALHQTLVDLLGEEGVCVAITSSTRYPELVKMMLENVGLTPEQIGKITYVPFTVPQETASKKSKEMSGWRKLLPWKDTTPPKDETIWSDKHEIIRKTMQKTGVTDPADVCIVDDLDDVIDGAKAAGFENSIRAKVNGIGEDINYLQEVREFAGLERLGKEFEPQRAGNNARNMFKKPPLAAPTGHDPNPPSVAR